MSGWWSKPIRPGALGPCTNGGPRAARIGRIGWTPACTGTVSVHAQTKNAHTTSSGLRSEGHERRRWVRERTAFVLIHGPICGPDTWWPVADALGAGGTATVVPALEAHGTAPYWRS